MTALALQSLDEWAREEFAEAIKKHYLAVLADLVDGAVTPSEQAALRIQRNRLLRKLRQPV